MKDYILQITAQQQHIDELGHVNNAVWVQWIQAIATAHWNQRAPRDMIDQYIWVVTRHEIDYRGNVKAGETVNGRTWISQPPRGARFWRNVSFTGTDGKLKMESKTLWALLDRQSGRPMRVPQILTDLFLID